MRALQDISASMNSLCIQSKYVFMVYIYYSNVYVKYECVYVCLFECVCLLVFPLYWDNIFNWFRIIWNLSRSIWTSIEFVKSCKILDWLIWSISINLIWSNSITIKIEMIRSFRLWSITIDIDLKVYSIWIKLE